MCEYPYIHANAKRCNWGPSALKETLRRARLDKAPDDSFSYAPEVSNFWDGDSPSIWHTVSGLRQKAEAGCIHSKLVLEELEACVTAEDATIASDPIAARKLPSGELILARKLPDGELELVNGHHRYLAAIRAGLTPQSEPLQIEGQTLYKITF